jgi:eukaryotic-like serine/threonine-protein kinase
LQRGGPAAALQPGTRWATRAGASLPAGTVVADRYEIADVRGVGGSGIVYRATDRTLGETVALKMLRPELVTDDPRAREELKRELRLTRRVSHRNVVRTYDFGTSNGIPFLTMEYVDGTALSTVIAHRGSLPTDAVVALGRQLVRALDVAHEQGITHGDLKPANLLVTLDGLLKVTDFGVASIVRRPKSPRASPAALDDEIVTPHLVGAVIGTPEYMAPELLVGGQPDVRTDVYAAGMVLHECLTGSTPFQRDTPRGFLAQKLDPPTPPRRTPTTGSIDRNPATLEALIAWMTAPDSSDRPASAAEVGAVLARFG